MRKPMRWEDKEIADRKLKFLKIIQRYGRFTKILILNSETQILSLN